MPIARRRNVPTILSQLRDNIDMSGVCHVWLRGHGSGSERRAVTHLRGKAEYVSRVLYEELHGPIPEGMRVCHRCDHPWCVNDQHFFLGTDADNQADKAAKNRIKGEKHSRAVLTEAQARAILSDTRTHQSIADDYGVSRAAITLLKRRVTWTHIS